MEEDIKGKTKQCIRCRLDIPIDATKCPYCKSKQTTTSGFKVFMIILIIIALLYGSWKAFKQYKISGVKNGYLSNYSDTVSVGDALDSFLGNEKWDYKKNQDGTEIVSVSGECYYLDQPAIATIQFSLLNGGSHFSMTGFKINGKDLGLFSSIAFGSLYEKAIEGL